MVRSSGCFEFEEAALGHPSLVSLQLDPRLGLFEGRQHPAQGSETFGVFADASPDRWGRLLMRRRLERAQRAGRATKTDRLGEAVHLLVAQDPFPSGAMRVFLHGPDEVLDNPHG